MKKIIIIASSVLVIGAVAVGHKYQEDQVAKTTIKAKETMKKPENKKRMVEIEQATGKTAVNEDGKIKTNTTKAGSQSNISQNELNTYRESTSGRAEHNPESTSILSNSNQRNQSATSNNQPNQSATSNNQANTSSKSDSTNSSSNSNKKKTKEEITSTYRTVFGELEAQETSKIDQLVVQAKADYVSKKYTNAELAVKYQEAAKALESNADKSFNILYQQMQFDLETNGFSINDGQGFKTDYQAKKEERRNRVVKQVTEF
ncbi:hypothetical protein [Bacillus sp. V5-8f]|uniref:hypothetical protein n=1 Tax=Bacillus sp. V5-8f TaxID=2053044 RepID=UPI000C75CB19|nr:hypothetical protein [Bacillus sp. V5-8f]PLT35742.1 hypothetical protein CUU64_00220 [Bacillus sp. V5-8f]